MEKSTKLWLLFFTGSSPARSYGLWLTGFGGRCFLSWRLCCRHSYLPLCSLPLWVGFNVSAVTITGSLDQSGDTILVYRNTTLGRHSCSHFGTCLSCVFRWMLWRLCRRWCRWRSPARARRIASSMSLSAASAAWVSTLPTNNSGTVRADPKPPCRAASQNQGWRWNLAYVPSSHKYTW